MLSRVLLFALLVATPAHAVSWIRIGDPGNPPDTTPADTVATTGLCEGTSQLCRINLDCAPGVACIKFPWPDEYQSRGAVAYAFDIAQLPVSVAEFAAYLNATGRVARSVALNGLDIVVNPILDIHRTIPPVLSGTPGNYTALLPDYPWPYANRDEAMRYVNWLDDGDETTGSYDCTGTNCDPTRLPGARFFLPDLHEWRKAATWDPFSQSYWWMPGNAGAEPEPGVDANVACSPGWCFPVGNCNGGTQYPLAECALVPNGSYPHYQSPWGVEDMCGNLTEVSESCGETLGELDCDKMIMMGIHTWFPSFDCQSTKFQQANAHANLQSKVRIARVAVPYRGCGILGAEALLPLMVLGLARRRFGRGR